MEGETETERRQVPAPAAGDAAVPQTCYNPPIVSAARPSILFVAECVTLAQVVRLKSLADALDPERYEIHFASSEFSPLIFEGASFTRWNIHSIPAVKVHRAQTWGFWPYTRRVLQRYVEEETQLLENLRPAAVIGDFRLSLTVSAPLAGVPYLPLINAYWSPHCELGGLPVPDHPLVAFFGEHEVKKNLHKVERSILRRLAAPLNDLRRRHGLAAFADIKEALTSGDRVLYVDTPGLCPTGDLPAHHDFLGAALWAPKLPPPPWWDEPDDGRPWVYVTLGSSGRKSLLPLVLEAFARMPVNVMAATAGSQVPRRVPPNVRLATYLPGDRAAARASVVVCNGGSTTGYQALAAGKPVLGIPWNMDQYLATRSMVHAGAAIRLRSGHVSPNRVRWAVDDLLGRPSYGESARRVAAEMERFDAGTRFRRVISRLMLVAAVFLGPGLFAAVHTRLTENSCPPTETILDRLRETTPWEDVDAGVLVRATHLRSYQAAYESDEDRRAAIFRDSFERIKQGKLSHPRHPGILLWHAALDGAVALTRGKLTALSALPRMEKQLLELRALDPAYDAYAADRSLAELYHAAPNFISIGSARKAREHYDAALRGAPEFPPNRILYARFLADQDEPDKARDILAPVVKPGAMDGFPVEKCQWTSLVDELLPRLKHD